MSIAAGRFRHEIRIERLVDRRDENGSVIQDPESGATYQDWRLVAKVRAAIEPLSAREFIQSAATQSQVTARIVIRYRDGMNSAMRLVHAREGRPDVIYNPHGVLVDPDSGLEYLTMPCSQGVGEGQ